MTRWMALHSVILMVFLTACQPLRTSDPVGVDSQTAYVELAEAYLDAELWTQAEQATARAARHAGNDPRVTGLWARLAAARGDHPLAEAYFRKAAPSDLRVAHHYAQYLLAQGRPADALYWLSQLTQAQTYVARADAWKHSGQAHEALAQLRQADDAYRARLRLLPEDPDALTDWVLIAAKQGRIKESLSRLESAQGRLGGQVDWSRVYEHIGAIQARFRGLTDGFGVRKH